MSKLKQPSVSDSFNAPSNKPDNPNGINWKQMLFHLLLAFVAGGTFGTIMHFSNKRLLAMSLAKKEDNKQLATTDPTKIENQSTLTDAEEIKVKKNG